MWICFFFFFLLPIYLCPNWEQFSADDSDLSVYNHVSVITGNLNLAFQDGIAKGGLSIPINRTYTSAGALERDRSDFDLYLKLIRGEWMIQGGWSFFPHADLLIEAQSGETKSFKIYLPESNGNLVTYEFSHWEEKRYAWFCPKLDDSQAIGSMSARTNIRRNRMRFDWETSQCILYLANGGIREYSGRFPVFQFYGDPRNSDESGWINPGPFVYYRLNLDTNTIKKSDSLEYLQEIPVNQRLSVQLISICSAQRSLFIFL